MTWLAALLCAVSAALHLACVVPRLTEPPTAEGEPAPGYATLVSARAILLLGGSVMALAHVLHRVPAEQWGVWFGYLGAGAALVWVDLRTTWLPLTLHRICAAQVVMGLAYVAVKDWPTALGSVAGGCAAYGLFHLVWRFSATFGYGDVRLAGTVGAMGALWGLEGWLLSLLCGTLIGAIWGIAHTLARRGTQHAAHFPYGPALWLGPVVAAAVSGW
ncbi:A24 family peptidase [Tessaracoccus antarcticus]|uniref:Prepilin peptidase n=1 Tax=Tessaracoccus antarcticus TaxID=2479848 RepID=A0A3M0GEQ3_9ACTN|nr:prepilin peptidase [Tessaracoccus antarcticus]RMB59649.1 prepilin peptidase [Tessaracoccus antarcticus]